MLPPMIDNRNIQSLIEKMKQIVPHYTPEWRFSPEDPDPGSTLFLIVANMLQENIHRMNKIPMKNFIAFLNMLNVSLLPAKPSQAFVTFILSEGTKHSVYIPAQTQVSASVENVDDDIIFETEGNLLATPANFVASFQVHKELDRIIQHKTPLFEEDLQTGFQQDMFPFTLYDFQQGQNLQEHAFYIGHKHMFNIKGSAQIVIEFRHTLKRYSEKETCTMLSHTDAFDWLYRSDESWIHFDEVRAEGNCLVLKKHEGHAIDLFDINGLENRWIKCQVKDIQPIINEPLEFNMLQVKADYDDINGQGGMTPDLVLHDDMEVDLNGFYPFGEIFAPFSTLYVSSQEVFSKKSGDISLSFDMSFIANQLHPDLKPKIDWKLLMKKSKFEEEEFPPITISKVIWEYWNGTSWANLATANQYEQIFNYQEESAYTMNFKCPADIEETFVNSEFDFWIRARVVSIENLYSAESVYLSPWIENIRLSYHYPDTKYPPEYCLTKNNLEFRDRSLQIKFGGDVFQPFLAVDSDCPSFYMGFDQPPIKGPISMFFSIEQQKYKDVEMPNIEWQYLSQKANHAQWSTLKTLDDTNHFTQSGTIRFTGPNNFLKATLFGQTLYWIRAVNRHDNQAGQDQKLPVVNGIYLNCTRVIQQESMTNEIPEKISIIESNHEYKLSRPNIVSEEIWVDETEQLSEEDIDSLMAEQQYDVQVLKDTSGHLQKVSVKWLATDLLYQSRPTDRHYSIDRSSGCFQFGDGINGMVPPHLEPEYMQVNYKVAIGKMGNVNAEQISNLQSSIAFVQSVSNPEPASGGCNTEILEEAISRGPQIFKHRNRAVTAEDFEALVKQAYPDIAKVKCLANHNVHLEKEVGCITVVILPRGVREDSSFFPEIKKQVESYLTKRTANVVAYPNCIQVIEPAYFEISIYANLAVEMMDDVVPTEWQAIQKLNQFLDPIIGNYDGKGWAIGEEIHISIFYALLKSVRTVNFVEKCTMTINKIEDGKRIEMNSNIVNKIPHCVIVNGKHQVNVNVI